MPYMTSKMFRYSSDVCHIYTDVWLQRFACPKHKQRQKKERKEEVGALGGGELTDILHVCKRVMLQFCGVHLRDSDCAACRDLILIFFFFLHRMTLQPFSSQVTKSAMHPSNRAPVAQRNAMTDSSTVRTLHFKRKRLMACHHAVISVRVCP